MLYNLSLKKFVVGRDVTFKEQDRLVDDDDMFNATLEFTDSHIPNNDVDHVAQQPNFEHVPLVVPENTCVDVLAMDHGELGIQNVATHRTFTRVSHPPVWMKDCVAHMTDSPHPYSVANYMTYDKLSSTYQAYLSDLSADTEPRTS